MSNVNKSMSLTILDFENYAGAGIVPMSYFQGATVTTAARITNQYLNQGIIISNAAVVELGLGHAGSGKESLAPISASGKVDYDSPITFTFVRADSSLTHSANTTHGKDPILQHYHDATTDYFAFTPDKGGSSGNTVTLSGYDKHGKFLGSASYKETGNFTEPLVLTGIGDMHSVVVDTAMRNPRWGGISLDLITFNETKSVGNLLAENFGKNVPSSISANYDQHSVVQSTVYDDLVSLVGLNPIHQDTMWYA